MERDMLFHVLLHVRHENVWLKAPVQSMARTYYVAKQMIEDEFLLLHEQCWEDEAILSHCPFRIINYQREAFGKEFNQAWCKCEDIDELWYWTMASKTVIRPPLTTASAARRSC